MKIAIQGHLTRGKDVIKILESLGGENGYDQSGSNEKFVYFINNIGFIYSVTQPMCSSERKIYTLEEFEKEFPFKIGDKIKHISSTGIIKEYCYINNEPAYKIESIELGIIVTIPVKMLELYKEMKEERNITLTLDKAKEQYKKGGELKEIALQAFTEKELTKVDLPKTWEEYIQQNFYREGYVLTHLGDIAETTITGLRGGENLCPSKESAEAHLAMIQLEQLRNYYRGLFTTVVGMPVWCIRRWKGELVLDQRVWGTNETFLTFQSKEVAEKYLKNFKPLIEKAGDLIS